jgi:parallel beta-helix repeat protein
MKPAARTVLVGACALAIVGSGMFATVPAFASQHLTTRAVGSHSVHTPLTCGDVVTVDTVLHTDLVDCPDNGLVIGADGVRIDLNGHRISGDSALNEQCAPDEVCDVGIDNSAGHRDVVIKNGTLRDFAVGILVIGARDNRLTRLRVSQSLFSGLIVVDADHTEIQHSTVTANGLTTDQAGIAVFASRGTGIEHDVVSGNGDIGLFAVEGTDSSRIAHSVFADNFEAGIILEGSDNQVAKNRFRRNGDGLVVAGDGNVIRGNHVNDTLGCDGECGNAISFEGGSNNLVQGNLIKRTIWGIRLDAFTGLASDTVVRGNVVRGASIDGIVVDLNQVGPVTGTVVDRNRVFRSGDDGIDVNAEDATLTRNVANHNSDLGIEAVAGVTDDGGNRAAGNGNPLQCIGVSC